MKQYVKYDRSSGSVIGIVNVPDVDTVPISKEKADALKARPKLLLMHRVVNGIFEETGLAPVPQQTTQVFQASQTIEQTNQVQFVPSSDLCSWQKWEDEDELPSEKTCSAIATVFEDMIQFYAFKKLDVPCYIADAADALNLLEVLPNVDTRDTKTLNTVTVKRIKFFNILSSVSFNNCFLVSKEIFEKVIPK